MHSTRGVVKNAPPNLTGIPKVMGTPNLACELVVHQNFLEKLVLS